MWKILFILLLGVTGVACQSNGVKPENKKVQDNYRSLVELILYEKDEDKLLERIQRYQGAMGIDDATSIPIIDLLVASRSPKVVRAALSKGADVSTTVVFAKELNGLVGQTTVERTRDGFRFTGNNNAKSVGNKRKKKSLSNMEQEELVKKLALVYAYKAEKEKQDERIGMLETDYKKWQEQVKAKVVELEKPIPTVPQPELPPVEKHKKSVFESIEMFQNRISAAKEKRAKQNKFLNDVYRSKVMKRNEKVKANKEKLEALKLEADKKNWEFKRKRIEVLNEIRQEVDRDSKMYISKALSDVYGPASIQAVLVNGKPGYNAETQELQATVEYANLADKHDLIFSVPISSAEKFYNALRGGELYPRAVVNFSDKHGGNISVDGVEVEFDKKKYLGVQKTGLGVVAQKSIEVVLQDKSHVPKMKQAEIEPIAFNQVALESLRMQNPNIKDVKFEAYLLEEKREFNDDIPQLFAKAKKAGIDRKKWLFVVGIGQYDQTDDILYSRRSAEWFAKVAAKTLGVQKGRQIVLLDKEASSGAIKDQLKLMLSKVKKGDEIVFYYSGHGLPVSDKGNQPYILPSDKIPDFISDDDFYQAKNIYQQLMNSQASSVLAFMDSCFTGQTDGKSVFGGSKAATRLQPKSFNPGSQGKVAILTAGNDKQFSNAYGEKGHRLFSYYLIKAMIKGYDQIGDLATKVKSEVNDTSIDMGGLNRQTPVFVGNPTLGL